MQNARLNVNERSAANGARSKVLTHLLHVQLSYLKSGVSVSWRQEVGTLEVASSKKFTIEFVCKLLLLNVQYI